MSIDKLGKSSELLQACAKLPYSNAFAFGNAVANPSQILGAHDEFLNSALLDVLNDLNAKSSLSESVKPTLGLDCIFINGLLQNKLQTLGIMADLRRQIFYGPFSIKRHHVLTGLIDGKQYYFDARMKILAPVEIVSSGKGFFDRFPVNSEDMNSLTSYSKGWIQLNDDNSFTVNMLKQDVDKSFSFSLQDDKVMTAQDLIDNRIENLVALSQTRELRYSFLDKTGVIQTLTYRFAKAGKSKFQKVFASNSAGVNSDNSRKSVFRDSLKRFEDDVNSSLASVSSGLSSELEIASFYIDELYEYFQICEQLVKEFKAELSLRKIARKG